VLKHQQVPGLRMLEQLQMPVQVPELQALPGLRALEQSPLPVLLRVCREG
jgi:hypothetical protein